MSGLLLRAAVWWLQACGQVRFDVVPWTMVVVERYSAQLIALLQHIGEIVLV